jgi:hypothetical protein
MIGAIWKGVKLARKSGGAIVAGLESKDDIVALWDQLRADWDSDGDGKPDPTVEEAVNFLAQVFIVISKRL